MNNESDKNRLIVDNSSELDLSVSCQTQYESQLPRLEPRDRLPPSLFNRDWIESKISGSSQAVSTSSSGCGGGGGGVSRDVALTSSYLFNKTDQMIPKTHDQFFSGNSIKQCGLGKGGKQAKFNDAFITSSSSSSTSSSPLSPLSPFAAFNQHHHHHNQLSSSQYHLVHHHPKTTDSTTATTDSDSTQQRPKLTHKKPTHLPLFVSTNPMFSGAPLHSIQEFSSGFKCLNRTSATRSAFVATNQSESPTKTDAATDDVFIATSSSGQVRFDFDNNNNNSSNNNINKMVSLVSSYNLKESDLNSLDEGSKSFASSSKNLDTYMQDNLQASKADIGSEKRQLDDDHIESASLLMPFKSVNQAPKAVNDSNESPNHLKRTQAFTDLPNIDDLSTVTFLKPVNNKPQSEQQTQNGKEKAGQKLKSDLSTQENLPLVMGDTVDDTNSSCYIEEKKVIISGIKVRAAKVSKLVQIFMDSFDKTGKVQAYTDFPRVFILMHKWFMESIHLTDILFDLYNLYNQYQDHYTQKADKEYYAHQQLKICYAFNFWLSKFPFHFALDSNLTESVKRFTNLIAIKKQRNHLKYVDITKIESYDWMRKLTTRNPMRSKQKITLAFNKIEPDVLASQLTYLEWKTLRRINFGDYKAYAVKGIIHDNPPMERSIHLFNGLSQWIQSMVLSKTTPKQRADIIHKFICVARHLRQLQNFNSLMAVIGGICHSAIARLSKTNLHLSLEDQTTLNDFMELLSSNYNYGQYRKTISEIQGFYIPIIGIHLKDMISLHTAHLDRIENDLINFRKMAQLSVIFQSLTNLQNSVPPVQENRDLIKLLQLSLDMSYSEDEMYELSLSREPRTSISSPISPTRISPFADWAKSISTPLDPQTIQKHVNAMVEAVYKNYDHDKDGFISHDEFYEIAQNFPFIDTFAVLDADKDGMISKIEMKAYFLKANYNALKSEFKHDFHETTYFKLTFCTHCDGLLWGLIKQGWKCKDCGISAHRLCKERVVIECRPKRNSGSLVPSRIGDTQLTTMHHDQQSMPRNRSVSNTSTTVRKKSSFKQKSTQTEMYDDLFISDESLTSNDEESISFVKSVGMSKLRKYDESSQSNNIDHPANHNRSPPPPPHPHTSRPQRHVFKKANSKRRKSLPSQNSSNEAEHQTVTLIPRGPLICSNNESGMETNFFSKNQFPTQKISPFKAKQATIPQQTDKVCTTSDLKANLASPETLDYDMNSMSLTPCDPIESPTAENSSHLVGTAAGFMSSKLTSPRSRIYSDSSVPEYPEIRHYIDDFKKESEQSAEVISASDSKDVFYKLKEEGEKRLKLERENAKLKKELESTNAQITTLREKMSFISNESVLSLSDKANNKSTDDLDTKSIETGESKV